jgi:hypothetical protein
MSASLVYQQVHAFIQNHLDPRVDGSSLHRLGLFVTGLIAAKNGRPAQVAKKLASLQLGSAKAESLERQIRRMDNDPEIRAEYCFHPLVRAYLAKQAARRLFLILDPTLQEDRVVMVSLNLWYQGRSLPLVWTLWAANIPLKGAGFWKRIDGLLDQVAPLLPMGVEVIVLADRAFGTPAFTDLVSAHGWHWLVRVQDQTHYQDRQGRSGTIRSLVRFRGQRRKLRGQAFKKAGWRTVSIVVYWGARHTRPLCLVSDLKAEWLLIHWYRQRFPIEGTFRDYKSYGWGWEQSQVVDLGHMEHLLVGMALGSWIALLAGTWRARQFLQQDPSGKRYTRPWEAKQSLFQHGLEFIQGAVQNPQEGLPPVPLWQLAEADRNWSAQITAHHAFAFLFGV